MYNAFFYLTTGQIIRMRLPLDGDLEEVQDGLANALASKGFWHFFENGKLTIINMSNVAYIKVAKAE